MRGGPSQQSTRAVTARPHAVMQLSPSTSRLYATAQSHAAASVSDAVVTKRACFTMRVSPCVRASVSTPPPGAHSGGSTWLSSARLSRLHAAVAPARLPSRRWLSRTRPRTGPRVSSQYHCAVPLSSTVAHTMVQLSTAAVRTACTRQPRPVIVKLSGGDSR